MEMKHKGVIIIASLAAAIMLIVFAGINGLPIKKTVIKIDAAYPVIAFTFDDGPSENTMKILKILHDNRCVGTFFINGKNISGNERIIKQTVSRGNELANHTYNHYDLTLLTKDQIVVEIQKTQEAAAAVLPDYTLKFVRPPYGHYNDEVLDAIAYPVALWNIDSGDWTGAGSDEICETVLDNIKDGSVVIFHDTGKNTVDALKKIIPRLMEQGYQAVTLSQLYAYRHEDLSPHNIYS